MTLVQLEYILAVAEFGNFTLAAEKSFVTQPTLSMQIQKLESELEIEIFDRSEHPIKPTRIGQKVIDQAKAILNESKKLTDIVFEERDRLEGSFKLGVLPTLLPTLVPMFYKIFHESHPNIELVIKEMTTEEILDSLHDGTIDFALAVTPLEEPGIREKVLFYEPLAAYIPENHFLHDKKKLTVADLDTDDILLLKEGNCFRNNVLNLCEPKKLKEPAVRLDSRNLETLVKLSNEGYGMTILPMMQTDDLPENDKKNVRHFETPVPTREVSLISHQSNLRKSFEDSLSKTIQSVLRGKIFYEKIGNVTSPLLSLPKRKRG